MFSRFIFLLGIVTFFMLCVMALLTIAAFIWAKVEDHQRKDNLKKAEVDPDYWKDYYGE